MELPQGAQSEEPWRRSPQPDFQASGASPALLLLPAVENSEYSLLQQTDSLFLPLRAYPDVSTASGLWTSDRCSLSQNPLLQSLSQHSLELTGREVCTTTEEEETLFLSRSVPAGSLLALLQRDMGVPSSSSSAVSSRAEGPEPPRRELPPGEVTSRTLHPEPQKTTSGVTRTPRDQDQWNQMGMDASYLGSYLGFLPQSQSTPGVFKAPTKSSTRTRTRTKTRTRTGSRPDRLSAVESESGSVKSPDLQDQVHSLPSLSYLQKVDAWRTNQSPALQGPSHSTGSLSANQSSALQGPSHSTRSLSANQSSALQGPSHSTRSLSANQSPALQGPSHSTRSLSANQSSALQGPSHSTRSLSANQSPALQGSSHSTRSLSANQSSALQGPSHSTRSLSANQSSALPGSSHSTRSLSANHNVSSSTRRGSAAGGEVHSQGSYAGTLQSSLNTVVPSGQKKTPEEEEEEAPPPPPPPPRLSLGQFSDVSPDPGSQDSCSGGVRTGASIGGASSINSLDVDNYVPDWTPKTSTTTTPTPPEINIDQRIPLYLRNLGIDQSPSSILRPFGPRGPIREPEFSPTDISTFRGSVGTKSSLHSEGGSPHKRELDSLDSSSSVPLSLDSLGPGPGLGPGPCLGPGLGPGLPLPDEDSSLRLYSSLSSSQDTVQEGDLDLSETRTTSRDLDLSETTSRDQDRDGLDKTRDQDQDGLDKTTSRDLDGLDKTTSRDRDCLDKTTSRDQLDPDLSEPKTTSRDQGSLDKTTSRDLDLSETKTTSRDQNKTTKDLQPVLGADPEDLDLWTSSRSTEDPGPQRSPEDPGPQRSTSWVGSSSNQEPRGSSIGQEIKRAEPEGCSAAPPDNTVQSQQQQQQTVGTTTPPVVTTPPPEETRRCSSSSSSSSSCSSSSLALRVAKLLQSESSTNPSISDLDHREATEWMKMKVSGQQSERLELDLEDRRRIEEIKKELLLKNPVKSWTSTDTESSTASSLRVQADPDQNQILQRPGPDLESRVQRPGPDLESRVQRPGPDLESRVQRPGPDLESRVQRPGLDLESRVQRPGPDMESRVQRPGLDLESRVQRPGPDMESRVQRPGPDLESRVQRPGPDLESRVQRPGLDLESRVQEIAAREGVTLHPGVTITSCKRSGPASSSGSAPTTPPLLHLSEISTHPAEDETSEIKPSPSTQLVQGRLEPTEGPTGAPIRGAIGGPTGGPTAELTGGPTGGLIGRPIGGPTGEPTRGHTTGPTREPTGERPLTPSYCRDDESTGSVGQDPERDSARSRSLARRGPVSQVQVLPPGGPGPPGLRPCKDLKVPLRHSAASSPDEGVGLSSPPDWCDSRETYIRTALPSTPRPFTSQAPVPVLLPYKPRGSEDFFYVPQSDVSSITSCDTTMESSHTGSDDAVAPVFSSEVLGQRDPDLDPGPARGVNIRHREGIYSKRKTSRMQDNRRIDQDRRNPDQDRRRDQDRRNLDQDQRSPDLDQGTRQVPEPSNKTSCFLDQSSGGPDLDRRRDQDRDWRNPDLDQGTRQVPEPSNLDQSSGPHQNWRDQDQDRRRELHQDWRNLDQDRRKPDQDQGTGPDPEPGNKTSHYLDQRRDPDQRDQDHHWRRDQDWRRDPDQDWRRDQDQDQDPGSTSLDQLWVKFCDQWSPDESRPTPHQETSLLDRLERLSRLIHGTRTTRTPPAPSPPVPESQTRSSSGSMSTVDTVRLVRVFGAHRVQNLKTSTSLGRLYRTIDRQRESRAGQRESRGVSETTTDLSSVSADSASSVSSCRRPPHNRKSVRVISRGVQAGDVDLTRKSTLRHSRDVGTSFPSPNSSSSSERPRAERKRHRKKFPKGVSWFISAEPKSESRKENQEQEEASRSSTSWFQVYTRSRPWREPLRPRPVHQDQNHSPPGPDPETRTTTKTTSSSGLTLQEALALHRPHFISSSRSRVERLALQAEERRLQEEQGGGELCSWSERGGGGRRTRLDPAVPRKEMIQRSKQIYENLPEVVRRREEQRRRAEYRSYRLNAQLYNKRITNRVLGRRTAWH